ncbi:DEAD/DEAH box helicase [uncultured Abiotrophia sp.]|jgi:hypothetical protein|uniref:DEAD/DEAH box helicase n=1 Tax=uncultured Abiotrophia sp. TaxID=316094 RepID=UPI0028DD3CA4|nr:DEAD/DEAH box helicase [uncultured Abiotrophia sp.]
MKNDMQKRNTSYYDCYISDFSDFNQNWECSRYVSQVVDTPEGRTTLIRILDNWEMINIEAKAIWIDLLERAGFYPYYIEKISNQDSYVPSFQGQLRASFFKSEHLNIYFHEQQKEVEIKLSKGQNVAVSAPTSFGKSLLIEEFVARKKYKNILIIQPTLALIDETRRKLSKYSDYYNLVVNSRQKVLGNNLFILTAERVLEISNLPHIDFFVIDEFYKISNRRNDARIDALNVALLKIMKMEPQAMFLTPTVDSLSKEFREKYNVDFFKTDYALVNTNIIEVRSSREKVLFGKDKKKRLFELLSEQKAPSIVYVKSPNEAYKLARDYIDYLGEPEVVNPDLKIYGWMDECVSEDWNLKELMKCGIGAHNGALPRHVVNSEIDLFNQGKLNVLFSTVSLIEGVNTVAKNMFIYSPYKGKERIDFFDYSNIKGRAGRMGNYYTGNVYLFNDVLQPEDFIIDVPCVDQKQVSDEILVNIDIRDLKDRERASNLVVGLSQEAMQVIKRNMINIQGQKQLYNYIKENKDSLSYLSWTKIPSYDDLKKTLELGQNYLGIKMKFSAPECAYLSLDAINFNMKKMIEKRCKYLEKKKKNAKDIINDAINDVLRFRRSDASFTIPKLLAVMDSLQKLVFREEGDKCGDYLLFASALENEGVEEAFQFLLDYGLPSSAIHKIQDEVPESMDTDSKIKNYIKENYMIVSRKLLPYEELLTRRVIE